MRSAIVNSRLLGGGAYCSIGITSILSRPNTGRRWGWGRASGDRKSTRLNSSHVAISYAVFCLKKKAGVDRVILARRLPIDDILACANDRVAARRAACADTFGFLQKPDAHLKTKIGRSERADRTNIDRIKGIVIFQPLAWMRGQDCVTASVDKTEHIVLGDFLAETNAARTENAAFVIERDARPEHDIFRLLYLVLEEPRLAGAVIDAEFL